jgi:hypothetical protein
MHKRGGQYFTLQSQQFIHDHATPLYPQKLALISPTSGDGYEASQWSPKTRLNTPRRKSSTIPSLKMDRNFGPIYSESTTAVMILHNLSGLSYNLGQFNVSPVV